MSDPIADQTAAYVARARRLAPIVHAHAERAERTAQLPVEVAKALHQAGLFRMLLPVKMDGGGLTIPASLRVIEEVARLDGSAGWASRSRRPAAGRVRSVCRSSSPRCCSRLRAELGSQRARWSSRWSRFAMGGHHAWRFSVRRWSSRAPSRRAGGNRSCRCSPKSRRWTSSPPDDTRAWLGGI